MGLDLNWWFDGAASTVTTNGHQIKEANSGLTTSAATSKVGTAINTGRVWSLGQASAWEASSATQPSFTQPAVNPNTGRGFCDDANTLRGNTIPAGAWAATIILTSSSAFTAFPMIRVMKRASGNTTTGIAILAAPAASILITGTTFTLSDTDTNGIAGIDMAFAAGDNLYAELLLKITVAAPLSTDTVSLNQGAGDNCSLQGPDIIQTLPRARGVLLGQSVQRAAVR